MQFAQIFSLLMALSGFGVDANPKAATADQVLEHSVDDADLIVHLDVAAVVPRNFKALTDLPKDPALKASPDLVAMVKDVANQANQGRAMVKSMVGFDPVTDLQSVTVFLKFKPDGSDPDGLIEIRGTVPADLISKVSQMTGAPLEVFGGRSGVVLPDHKYLGIAKGGSVLVGTDTLVKPRLADSWKAPARAPGSRGARIAPLLDEKPFVFWAFTPTPGLLKMAEAKHGKNPMIGLAKEVDLWTGSLRTDGIVWATYAKTKQGFERHALAADGAIEMMRAFQIAPRGMAKIGVAYLDAFAGESKEVDELIRHKDDILKLVDAYSGDGQFKATVDKDPKARSVVVHAIGKRLTEVLPLGFVMPAAMIGFLTGRAEATGGPVQVRATGTGTMAPPPPPPPAKPAKPAKPPAKHP